MEMEGSLKRSRYSLLRSSSPQSSCNQNQIVGQGKGECLNSERSPLCHGDEAFNCNKTASKLATNNKTSNNKTSNMLINNNAMPNPPSRKNSMTTTKVTPKVSRQGFVSPRNSKTFQPDAFPRSPCVPVMPCTPYFHVNTYRRDYTSVPSLCSMNYRKVPSTRSPRYFDSISCSLFANNLRSSTFNRFNDAPFNRYINCLRENNFKSSNQWMYSLRNVPYHPYYSCSYYPAPLRSFSAEKITPPPAKTKRGRPKSPISPKNVQSSTSQTRNARKESRHGRMNLTQQKPNNKLQQNYLMGNQSPQKSHTNLTPQNPNNKLQPNCFWDYQSPQKSQTNLTPQKPNNKLQSNYFRGYQSLQKSKTKLNPQKQNNKLQQGYFRGNQSPQKSQSRLQPSTSRSYLSPQSTPTRQQTGYYRANLSNYKPYNTKKLPSCSCCCRSPKESYNLKCADLVMRICGQSPCCEQTKSSPDVRKKERPRQKPRPYYDTIHLPYEVRIGERDFPPQCLAKWSPVRKGASKKKKKKSKENVKRAIEPKRRVSFSSKGWCRPDFSYARKFETLCNYRCPGCCKIFKSVCRDQEYPYCPKVNHDKTWPCQTAPKTDTSQDDMGGGHYDLSALYAKLNEI